MKCIDEEIPFDIPESWEWCRMNELALYRKGPFGSSLTKSMFVPKSDTSIKVYEQKNAIQKDYRLGDYYIDKEKFATMQSFIVHPNDIIVSCAGTIGETYMLPAEAPIGIINQALMRVCLFDLSMAAYWQMYFNYVLITENQMKGAGSAIKNIPPFDYLKNILVPIPPVEEQVRISKRHLGLIRLLRSYDSLSRSLNSLNISINELMRKSILQYAIQGKLVPQIEAEGTAQELLEEIKQEKLRLVKEGKLKKSAVQDSIIYKGEDNKYYEKIGGDVTDITELIPFDIPTSWYWVRHNQLFEISGGSQPPKSHFIETPREGYIRLYQIRDYGKNPQPIYIPISEASKTTQKGDIILARYGASLGKVFYAEDGAYNVAMAKVIPQYDSNLILKGFIFLYYLSDIYQSQIKGNARSAQAGFNKEDLNDLMFPLPPFGEQLRIVEAYNRIIASITRR